MFSFLALAGLCLGQAGSKPGFLYWSAADLKALGGKLKPTGAVKIASESFGNWGAYSSQLSKRQADGVAELHVNTVDWFVAQGGEATLIVGGTMPDKKESGPGEFRSPKIEGGERRTLRVGDIVHIPQNTPHQLLVAKEFTYFVMKVKLN